MSRGGGSFRAVADTREDDLLERGQKAALGFRIPQVQRTAARQVRESVASRSSRGREPEKNVLGDEGPGAPRPADVSHYGAPATARTADLRGLLALRAPSNRIVLSHGTPTLFARSAVSRSSRELFPVALRDDVVSLADSGARLESDLAIRAIHLALTS
jgi:hypothetical protein